MAEQQPMMTRAGPVIRTIKFLLVISFFVLLLQIYLNPPERRGLTTCWPPYKLANLVGVDAFRLIAPKEHTAHLRVILFNEKSYYKCVDYTEKWIPFFSPHSKKDKPS